MLLPLIIWVVLYHPDAYIPALDANECDNKYGENYSNNIALYLRAFGVGIPSSGETLLESAGGGGGAPGQHSRIFYVFAHKFISNLYYLHGIASSSPPPYAFQQWILPTRLHSPKSKELNPLRIYSLNLDLSQAFHTSLFRASLGVVYLKKKSFYYLNSPL
jgi:hypothetical protein